MEQSKLDSERRKSRLQHPVSDRVLEQALNQDNRSSSPTAKQSPSSDSDKTIPKDDRVKQEDTAIPEHLKEVSSWIPGISMVYEQHGVRLYDWQVECMRQAVRQQNKNLLVSAPTSSGKTLVSWKAVQRCSLLFVSPYPHRSCGISWVCFAFLISMKKTDCGITHVSRAAPKTDE